MANSEKIRFVVRRKADGLYCRGLGWRKIWVADMQEADVWRGKAFHKRYAKRPDEYEVIKVELVRSV